MPKIKKTKITRLLDDQVIMMQYVDRMIDQFKEYIDSSISKMDAKVKRLTKGQQQLVDWTTVSIKCYIPKDLCILNLALYGMTIAEDEFDNQAEKGRFGTVIEKEGVKLYNFQAVFKLLFFSTLTLPLKELEKMKVHIPKPNEIVYEQAKIAAKAIRRMNENQTFYLDPKSMKKFEEEFYSKEEGKNKK